MQERLLVVAAEKESREVIAAVKADRERTARVHEALQSLKNAGCKSTYQFFEKFFGSTDRDISKHASRLLHDHGTEGPPVYTARGRFRVRTKLESARASRSTMDSDTILSDSEADLLLSTDWDPHEWISRGKKYHNVPPIVDTAQRNMLKIPASFANNLPSKTISGVDAWILIPNFFTTAEPTRDIEEILSFLALPTRTMLDTMVKTFGQAWFDDIGFPFWVLHTGVNCWKRANPKTLGFARVMGQSTGKTADEAAMKLAVAPLNVLWWHGNLDGTDIVDALLALLALRLRLCEDAVSEDTLIVDTTRPNSADAPPVVDGVATGPIKTSRSAQDYLNKYGAWFQNKKHRYLHFVLHVLGSIGQMLS
ncbi:hypothetical protein B0H10DRAFT_2373436 [Mycena sp. CBHHK59/15]|nr:hypothetical protein B0H10DRAFT_2373436 [Mycena sp. CBHHK59/15]